MNKLGDMSMKKRLCCGILPLICLFLLLANVALAEEVVLESQKSKSNPSSAVVKDKTQSSKGLIIGNSDTKRYHLPGMRYYNKVKKYHRVYFNSEQEAIDNGYYKAGTGRDLTGTMPQKDVFVETPMTPAASSAELEKNDQAAVEGKDKALENKAQDAPPVVEKQPEIKNESIPEKTLPREAAAEKVIGVPPATAAMSDVTVEPNVETEQKKNMAAPQDGVSLKREQDPLRIDKIAPADERPMRIEASYSFDYLDPSDPYGEWHSGQISFYHTVTPDFTYFIQGAGYHREEGAGATGTIGVYKGWTSFLYTFTSVSAGTKINYLPEYRIDQDFNFSIWPGRNLNFVAGVSYIDYFEDSNGWIVSGGPMIAFDKLILHYRLFYNVSNPGSVTSFSHLISLGYGQEGWQWTYLNVSFGKQAYLAAYVTPQEINQDSLSINLRHRHWLAKYYGVFGDVNYSKLEDGYDRYGIGLGVFYAF